MRFLSMIRVEEKEGQAPSERLMNDMGKLIEEMTRLAGSHRGTSANQGRQADALEQGHAVYCRRPIR